MAFSFTRSKATSNATTTNNGQQYVEPTSPKLPVSQMSKATKSYPNWLKDNATNLKQLPGIYQGVLGQVQLQLDILNNHNLFDGNKSNTNNDFDSNNVIKLVNNVKKSNPSEYMNRFTDTERVKQLLSMSRLSNETLATIWAYVNKTLPGRLTNREVCLALALIALFQNLEREGKQYHLVAGQKNDPFNLIKTEKKPPVPKLYPTNDSNAPSKAPKQALVSSTSVPNELSSANKEFPLIDINENISDDQNTKTQISGHHGFSTTNIAFIGTNPINLIDRDCCVPELLVVQMKLWLKVMTTMRALFKRAFDILNVEYSRQSSLEALSSPQGIAWCKNLCLCYPIAHNIKFKIDELAKKGLLFGDSGAIIDKKHKKHSDDLMVSINEYWAVLINLFHESGQIEFIELIMDGLNRTNETVLSETNEDLLNELDGSNQRDLCSICHTRFYLVNIGDALQRKELSDENLQLALDQEVITNDERYYYHARCANFWLNNVEPNTNELPFCEHNSASCEILKPKTISIE